MKTFESQIAAAEEWIANPRFAGISRLYSARDIAEQQGTILSDYVVARKAAEDFYLRLRELFAEGRSITTFGPYSPGQAVAIKRMGIEGIYLGGWATSAKGSLAEDPGPDLASYPLSQVPEEAGGLVRALLTADKNQHFARTRMSEQERETTKIVDFRPFIIADADTGHGGDAHVRNLIRRFVEVGVPGYHIEDQKPGTKKCGHQGGKVLVTSDEQIKRLNAARLQLDIMRVPGILVARTDAEAATLLESRNDDRDQPFILGATRTDLPSYKAGYSTMLMKLAEFGFEEVRGHHLFAISDAEYRMALDWLDKVGILAIAENTARIFRGAAPADVERALDTLETRYSQAWMDAARVKTYVQAVADEITLLAAAGRQIEMDATEWLALSQRVSFYEAAKKASELDIKVIWDCELPRTPDGYYHVQGGIQYAIAKSLAVAPFADLIWMETATADLEEARLFAHAIHAKYPDKMLAYNLSPSFNWDTTGMNDEEMRRFPEEIGKLGYVFNFITYAGHQIDGLAAEEFATALRQDGMLALARLQRKLRLTESPYRTPQALVGGPRLDAALMASSGRTAATKAMAKGSTHFQHLIQTDASPTLLAEWLTLWREHHKYPGKLRVELRPHTAGSEVLHLKVIDEQRQLADVIFTTIQDRCGRTILSVRDQNTVPPLRRKRLMSLGQLFLIHRYRVDSMHYLTPTEDNATQTTKMMKTLGIFSAVDTKSSQIIIGEVHRERVAELLRPDHSALQALIRKSYGEIAVF
jgi:isocitrate lyase